MKKVIIAFIMFSLCISGLLYSANRKAYHVVDIYICDTTVNMAELSAKAAVNRKDLYVASYCTCQGINSDMKSEVKDNSCDRPYSMVYSCICVGKQTY